MSYVSKRNSSITRGGRSSLTSSNDSKVNTTQRFYELEAAEVVDVILTEDHPEYLNVEDIGKIKYRFIQSQKNKPTPQLNWAKPFSARLSSYPLISEIVVIGKFAGSSYYIDTLNVSQSPNSNEVPFVSFAPSNSSDQTYEDALAGAGNTNDDNQSVSLGERFEKNESILRLEHDEGDSIFEGRFAGSIRLGSSEEGTSDVMIRSGQPEDVEEEGLIRENINKDPVSMWMIQNRVVELEPFVDTESDGYFFFGEERSTYEGPSIYNASDFSVENIRTRKDMFIGKDYAVNTGGLMAFNAVSSYNVSTRDSMNIDIAKNYDEVIGENVTKEIGGFVETEIGDYVEHTIDSQIVWNVPSMYFGKEDESEPIVLGQTLVQLLNDLLSALLSQTHPTPTGPSGPPINSAQFSQIQSQIQTILSDRNFTQ